NSESRHAGTVRCNGQFGRLFGSAAYPHNGFRQPVGRIRVRPHMVVDRSRHFVVAQQRRKVPFPGYPAFPRKQVAFLAIETRKTETFKRRRQPPATGRRERDGSLGGEWDTDGIGAGRSPRVTPKGPEDVRPVGREELTMLLA